MAPEKLKDFVRLRSLRCFHEAEQLFDAYLRHYLYEFPVCVEYAEFLLQDGRLQDVAILCHNYIGAATEPMAHESDALCRHSEELLVLRLVLAVAETSLRGSLSSRAIETCDDAWVDFEGSNEDCKEYALVLLSRISVYHDKCGLEIDYPSFICNLHSAGPLNAPQCAFAQNVFTTLVKAGVFQAANLIYGSTAQIMGEYARRELLYKILVAAIDKLPLTELDQIAVISSLQTYLHTLVTNPIQSGQRNLHLRQTWQWNENIEPLNALAGSTWVFKLHLPFLISMLGDIARGDGPASFLPYISFQKVLVLLLSKDGVDLEFFWPRAMSGVTRQAYFTSLKEGMAWTSANDFDPISVAYRAGIEPDMIIDHLMNQENQSDARLFSADKKQRLYGYVSNIHQFAGNEETAPSRAMVDAALEIPVSDTRSSLEGSEEQAQPLTEVDRQSTLDTVLRMASFSDKVDEMKRLICAGADIEGQDSLMRRPLHYAFMNQAASAVELLLQYEAEKNAVDWYGRTAFSLGSAWMRRD